MNAQRTLLWMCSLCLSVVFALSSPACAGDSGGLPDGWFAAGMSPRDYDMGVDKAVFKSGSASGFIAARGTPSGFGTLMQMCAADDYLGKRVRMSAEVKSENVENWAGMWFRVDGSGEKTLAFDNMQSRPIKGTTDWKRCEIVLDVPKDSVHLAFGILLDGPGRVWMDSVSFEEVGDDVASTDTMGKGPEYPHAPTALDFEK